VLSADQAGRDGDGFLNTPTQSFVSSGYALVFDPVELRGDNATSGVGAILGDVRIHAIGSERGRGGFIGIGPADAVEGYLADVERERLVGLHAGGTADQQLLRGGPPRPFRQSRRSGPPRRPDPDRSS
jgi:hypothetical protein